MSADARPATELPGDQMRALLADRTPLMCMRGAPAKRLRAQLPLAPDDVVRAAPHLQHTHSVHTHLLHRNSVYAAHGVKVLVPAGQLATV